MVQTSMRPSVHTRPQFDMTLVCTPDIGVALPPEGMPYPLLRERAEAACSTIDLLLGAGLDPEVLIPTQEDKESASSVVESFAKDEEKTSQAVTTNKISTMTPASLLLVRGVLDEFGHAVVERATHIRHLVTNKLILESDNPDPKIRIRALELLGKISDVGLFTERSEVTITHQSTDELKQSLRSKLNKLREKLDIVDVDVVSPGGSAKLAKPINLDEELGIPAPEMVEEVGVNRVEEGGAN
jgi:hypothetical protein